MTKVLLSGREEGKSRCVRKGSYDGLRNSGTPEGPERLNLDKGRIEVGSPVNPESKESVY